MKTIFLLLLTILICSGCKDNPPDRFTEIGSAVFGKSNFEQERVLMQYPEKKLPLELSVSPVSRTVWQISLICPPDIIAPDKVKEFAGKNFALEFGSSNTISLPGTLIEVTPAYDFGPQAVKIVFTDLEYRKLCREEEESPEADNIRRIRLAKNDILILENAVSEYYNETGKYPQHLGNLLTSPGIPGWHGPYLREKELPLDPWGKSYCYRQTGSGFELFSTGANGQEMLR